MGELDSHGPLCTEAAAALGILVIAVDYRLTPEQHFPAAPDDCEAAARWLAGSPAALGRTATGLIACGDSAGGNLAIALALALPQFPQSYTVIATGSEGMFCVT